MAAVGTLISAGVSLFTGLKSASLQKKAMRAQEKQQELADARERRRLLRQRQIAAGETVNLAASLGATGSSAVAGGLSGLTNQVQSQMGYQAQSSALAKKASGLYQQASNYQMFGGLVGNLFENMDLGQVGFSGGKFGFSFPS